ncbi:MAG: hotdog fold thioesterase [candidate division Zixibacteria bacterium]|nr:hotdog fold thioesterase [candidate division Zixibacteria bacterium]
MQEVTKYKYCFVCGDQNESGLKARFFVQTDGSVTSEYTVEQRFAGYDNIMHGGIAASLLDEVMIKAILKDDVLAVTAEMTVKFKAPVYVGQKMVLVGRVIESKGRLYRTEGVAEVAGKVVAEATGTYIRARGELAEELSRSLD